MTVIVFVLISAPIIPVFCFEETSNLMKILRVMFDSNTWRQVASPEKYPNDPRRKAYLKINEAIRSGMIEAFISETTIAIEQIKRTERLNWLKTCTQYSRAIDIPGMPPWIASAAVGLRPSTKVKPGVVDVVRNHLVDAAKIGMKILRVDRMAYPEAELLAALPEGCSIAQEQPSDDVKMREMFDAIEHFGKGLANLKRVGAQHTSDAAGIHWTDGIATLGPEHGNYVADLFGEWADGDAVAASVAHGLHAFCTLDNAKGASRARINSVLAPDFKELVSARLGMQFLPPEGILGNVSVPVS